jgi:pyruvate/2-oxoglutarate/acetoin dehydrogenase E1 component
MMTVLERLNYGLHHAMENDGRVFVLGEDILDPYGGAFKVTRGLSTKFPERVLTTPISEAAIAGISGGMALRGLRPVAEIMFGDFVTLIADQLINHAAKFRWMYNDNVRVPMVIRTPMGGRRGYGPTHSQSLEKVFLGVPGLKVIAPATPHDAKGLLKSAIRDYNPVIFIEAQLLYGTKGDVGDGEYTIPIGVAEVKRAGRDATIVAYSKMLLLALEAADQLSREGIEVEVIDPRTLKPLDLPTIVASVKKTGRLVIVEEGWRFCGLGAQIAESVYAAAFDYLDAPILRVTGEDVPMPYSRPLEDAAIPDKERVIEAVKALCGAQ